MPKKHQERVYRPNEKNSKHPSQDFREQIASLKQQVDNLQSELDRYKDQEHEGNYRHTTEVRAYRKTIQELTQSNEDLTKGNSALTQKIIAMESHIKRQEPQQETQKSRLEKWVADNIPPIKTSAPPSIFSYESEESPDTLFGQGGAFFSESPLSHDHSEAQKINAQSIRKLEQANEKLSLINRGLYQNIKKWQENCSKLELHSLVTQEAHNKQKNKVAQLTRELHTLKQCYLASQETNNNHRQAIGQLSEELCRLHPHLRVIGLTVPGPISYIQPTEETRPAHHTDMTTYRPVSLIVNPTTNRPLTQSPPPPYSR